MKWMKRLTGAAFAASALAAIVLTLKIYFDYDGSGQMYTAGVVANALKNLRIFAVVSLLVAVITAILCGKEEKNAARSVRVRYPENGKGTKTALIVGGIALLALLFLLLNVNNFASRDLEYAVGRLCLMTGPVCAVLLVCAYFLQRAVSIKPEKEERTVLLRIRLLLLFLAFLLIAYGVANGGMRDVFVKAINICTECIGLG